MGDGRTAATSLRGISIITCTNRYACLTNLFRNYLRQTHPKKELIIVVNDDSIPIAPYRRLASRIGNVQVYRCPDRLSLGACLNFAVRKTSYGLIAKFDDDDYYYAPYYLDDSLKTMAQSNADVVGKKAHYMYLKGSSALILRFSKAENRLSDRLPGATLLFKKSVIDKVPFPNRSLGEDDLFCLRSKQLGFRVFSGSKYNFVAIRRPNSSNHTWKISDREQLAQHKRVPNVRNYKKHVQRTSQGVR